MSDLGKIVVTHGGAYSASTAYEPLTMVTHNNATWMSVANTTGNAPSETSQYWKLIAKDGTSVTTDSTLSPDSDNAISNKAVATEFNSRPKIIVTQNDSTPPSDHNALWVFFESTT